MSGRTPPRRGAGARRARAAVPAGAAGRGDRSRQEVVREQGRVVRRGGQRLAVLVRQELLVVQELRVVGPTLQGLRARLARVVDEIAAPREELLARLRQGRVRVERAGVLG